MRGMNIRVCLVYVGVQVSLSMICVGTLSECVSVVSSSVRLA